jgi:hypothetical protein
MTESEASLEKLVMMATTAATSVTLNRSDNAMRGGGNEQERGDECRQVQPFEHLSR